MVQQQISDKLKESLTAMGERRHQNCDSIATLGFTEPTEFEIQEMFKFLLLRFIFLIVRNGGQFEYWKAGLEVVADNARQIPDKGDLRDYWIGISSAGDFLSTTPSYTLIRDPILRLCHRLIACSIAERIQAPEKAWVALGPERQLDAAVGALGVAQNAPAADEGRMDILEEDVHEIHGALTKQREVIDAMAHYFSRFCTWTTTSLARMMDKAGVTYMRYSETPREYQRRRVRQRTGEASTSTT
ncbi:hypothetical protein Tco_1207226 [Tanacetum coccineum]